MKFANIFFSTITLAVFSAAQTNETDPDSPLLLQNAARIAKTLLIRESLADIAALDPKTSVPVEFTEYYTVDPKDSSRPYFALVDLSSAHRNINFTQNVKEMKTSFSVRSQNHAFWDNSYNFTNLYPGSFPDSVLGAPRVVFTGTFKQFEVSEEDQSLYQEKFIARNGDSKYWIPGKKHQAHSCHWWTFDTETIYMVGGFGNMAYIGDIPVEEFAKAVPYTEKDLQEYTESVADYN